MRGAHNPDNLCLFLADPGGRHEINYNTNRKRKTYKCEGHTTKTNLKLWECMTKPTNYA